MKEGKYTVRYIGFHPLSDGGRGFEFAFSRSANTDPQLVSVEASLNLLSGPGHMAIQECAGICYETLKCLVASSETMPSCISLTSADVAQHRKQARPNGRR